MGAVKRKGRRKGTQGDDTTEPILKAVVTSRDLGAAGTEFERSLIASSF